MHKDLKPKVGVPKIGWSDFVNQMFRYFWCGSNPIRDRDLICFWKDFPISMYKSYVMLPINT
jgi:hypothetical protein